MTTLRTLLLVCTVLLGACQAWPTPSGERDVEQPASGVESRPAPALPVLDVAVARAPFSDVEVNWKHRLAQPYVYLEHRGDYRFVPARMQELVEAAWARGLELAGRPFALYFDDPGRVTVSELRARVCLPVAPGAAAPGEGWQTDLLESTTVCYAVVGGAYGDVPRSYPHLYAYLEEHGWERSGPLREIYLVDPTAARATDELLTEVQIPWAPAR